MASLVMRAIYGDPHSAKPGGKSSSHHTQPLKDKKASCSAGFQAKKQGKMCFMLQAAFSVVN